MWFDLHAHYPMHITSDLDADAGREPSLELMRRVRKRRGLWGRIQGVILWGAMKLASDKTLGSGPRISIESMQKGDVRLAMSMLFQAFEEIDLSERYGAPPTPDYFQGLLAEMEEVESEVGSHSEDVIRIVRNNEQLDACLESDAIGLIHAVEGGFHLGRSDEEIAKNCKTLGEMGVGYVTVAHLFFRQVATNAPALPFLPDWLYNLVFPQRGKDRLTPRGEAVVKGLVDNRILIDLTHMDPGGIAEVFDLLDTELDPGKEFPVFSTHTGYRFGKQQYMCDRGIVEKIAERDGVIGLIMAQHQLNDGLRKHKDYTKTLAESLGVIYAHIDTIAAITGGYDHIGLGTDFDGFIKPTMGGLDKMSDLAALDAALREKYGDEATDKMTSGNALRVLRRLWSEPARA
jgi:microsomal dipeptidase-like Zn-dependent dipeptidase